jgi:adenosylcobinamide-GDP ribazoletransferase
VVGALLGLVVAGVYAAASAPLSAPVAAVLATAAGIGLTGALHEDGLADTFDALGATTRADALRILADPAHGTYGVLAVALGTTGRILALGSIRPLAALGVLVAAHGLARAGAVGVLVAGRAAKDEGLGATYASSVSRRAAVAATVVGVAVGLVAMGPWAILAGAVVAGGATLVALAALRRFGGITGDVLGAVEQVGELAVLIVGAGVARAGELWW